MSDERVDVLLVCSPGGHLAQMLALEHAWAPHRRLWVTQDSSDTRSLLAGENVVFTKGQAMRSVRELFRNTRLAWRLIRRHRPAAIISTGAAVAVPVVWIGRLHRVRVIHVESISRIERLSVSGRLIAPAAHRFFVQWPELDGRRRGVDYAGSLFSFR